MGTPQGYWNPEVLAKIKAKKAEKEPVSEEGNFPFDRPYWTVNVSFSMSQVSKKEMIKQQVEAIAQSRGGALEVYSEPAPGFQGSFDYNIAFEEGDVNAYGFITRIQKEMAGFNPTVDFDEEDVTYPSTDEAKGDKKRYQFSLDEDKTPMQIDIATQKAIANLYAVKDQVRRYRGKHNELTDAYVNAIKSASDESGVPYEDIIGRMVKYGVLDKDHIVVKNDPFPYFINGFAYNDYKAKNGVSESIIAEMASVYLSEAKNIYTDEKLDKISAKINRGISIDPFKVYEWLNAKLDQLSEDVAQLGGESISTIINVNGVPTSVKVYYEIIDGEPEPTSVVDAETGTPVVANIEELEADDYDKIIDALYDTVDIEEDVQPVELPAGGELSIDNGPEEVVGGDMESSLETYVTVNGVNTPVQVKYTEIAPETDDEEIGDGTITVPEDIDLTKDDEPVSQATVATAQLPKSFTSRNGKTYVISAIINLQTGEDILSSVDDVELSRIQNAVDDLESVDDDSMEAPADDIPVNDVEPVAFDYFGGSPEGFAFESALEYVASQFPGKSLFGKDGLKAQLKEAITSLKNKGKLEEADNRIRIMPSHPDAVDPMEVPYEVWLGNMTVADVTYNEDGDFILEFMPRFETPDVKINDLKDIEHIITTWAKEKGLMEGEVVLQKKQLNEYSDEHDILSSEAEEIISSYLQYEDGHKTSDEMVDDIVGQLEDRTLPVDIKAIEKAIYAKFPESFPFDYVEEDNGMTAVADLVAQVSQDPAAKRQLDQELRKKQNELKKAQSNQGNQDNDEDQNGQNTKNVQNNQNGTNGQNQNGQPQGTTGTTGTQKPNGFGKPSGFTKPTGQQDPLNKAVTDIQKAVKTGGLKLKGIN